MSLHTKANQMSLPKKARRRPVWGPAGERAGDGKPSRNTTVKPPTLFDRGISRDQSSRWQKRLPVSYCVSYPAGKALISATSHCPLKAALVLIPPLWLNHVPQPPVGRRRDGVVQLALGAVPFLECPADLAALLRCAAGNHAPVPIRRDLRLRWLCASTGAAGCSGAATGALSTRFSTSLRRVAGFLARPARRFDGFTRSVLRRRAERAAQRCRPQRRALHVQLARVRRRGGGERPDLGPRRFRACAAPHRRPVREPLPAI